MPNTVPNQKIIHINREPLEKEKGFLSINKENWYAANKDLEPYGLVLYLYLAGNKDGFDLALSQTDAEQTVGIKKTSFHKYVNILIEKGYLVQKQGNVYDFYERPHIENKTAVPSCEQESLQSELLSLLGEQSEPQGNKEINNINRIDTNKYSDRYFTF